MTEFTIGRRVRTRLGVAHGYVTTDTPLEDEDLIPVQFDHVTEVQWMSPTSLIVIPKPEAPPGEPRFAVGDRVWCSAIYTGRGTPLQGVVTVTEREEFKVKWDTDTDNLTLHFPWHTPYVHLTTS